MKSLLSFCQIFPKSDEKVQKTRLTALVYSTILLQIGSAIVCIMFLPRVESVTVYTARHIPDITDLRLDS